MPKIRKLSARTKPHPRKPTSNPFLSNLGDDGHDYLRKLLQCMLAETIDIQKKFEHLQKKLNTSDVKSMTERLAENLNLEEVPSDSKEDKDTALWSLEVNVSTASLIDVEALPEDKAPGKDFYDLFRLNVRPSQTDRICAMLRAFETEQGAGDSPSPPPVSISRAPLLKRLSDEERRRMCRKKPRMPKRGDKRCLEMVKHLLFEEPIINDDTQDKELKDVPLLAVRAYIAIVKDMQRNCELYKTFRELIIRPIEMNQEPVMVAAYDCWMDYMQYIKNTLDCLQPYIVNLVKTCFHSPENCDARKCFETKLPKVLITSLKNIQPWRKALRETITCCQMHTKPKPQYLYDLYRQLTIFNPTSAPSKCEL